MHPDHTVKELCNCNVLIVILDFKFPMKPESFQNFTNLKLASQFLHGLQSSKDTTMNNMNVDIIPIRENDNNS